MIDNKTLFFIPHGRSCVRPIKIHSFTGYVPRFFCSDFSQLFGSSVRSQCLWRWSGYQRM